MSIRGDELPEYIPPRLPNATRRAYLFVLADAMYALGAVSLAVVATIDHPSAHGWTGWLLPAVWIAQLLAGWWLCDGLARSIHLLRGQWPTRRRVARAWAAPVVWVLFAELTILRFEPTQVVDVWPAIAAIGFWIVAWRPFAVLRRTFRSLTRRNHDAPVLVFGLLLIVSWSIGWWLLHADPVSGGGVTWGGAVAAGATVPMTVSLTHLLSRAIAYRILAIQTHEEHRYIRSLGRNPFHAGTYLELVTAKQERERRRGASPEVEELRAEQNRTGQDAASAPGDRDPSGSEPPGERSSDTGPIRGWWRTVVRSAEPSTPSGGRAAPTTEVTATTADPPPVASDDTVTADTGFETPGGRAVTPTSRPDDNDTVEHAALDDAAPEPATDPASSVAGPEIEPEQWPAGTPPPKVTSIETVRYLALAGLVAVAAGYAWITLIAVSLREPIVAGRLSDLDVGRLDEAGEWTTRFLVVAIVSQAWWVVAARGWVGRAGRRLDVRRSAVLAGATSAFAVVLAVARSIDAPIALQTALLIVVGTGGWLSILTATAVAEWAGHGQLSVRLWATGLVVAAIVHSLTGAMDSVTPTSSVQRIAFASLVLGLVLANTSIVAGVFMAEVEDDLKSSRRVAQWYRDRLHAEIESEGAASQR